MEILLGLVMIFSLWLIGKFFDRKVDEQNAKKNELSFSDSISEDPSKIVQFFRQDLNEISLSARELRIVENASILFRYKDELHIMCQCAQFLAIDRGVVNLQLRGPLISAFKKINSTAFETRYPTDRDAYLRDANSVGGEFLKKLDLTGAKAFAIDPSYANNRFHAVFEAACKSLTKAGVISAKKNSLSGSIIE
jgi:hypothetical protein